jgi:phage head maturation protease
MPDAIAVLVAPAPETVQITRQLRGLQLRAETFNPETRTIDVVFSTGARRTMFDWASWREIDEELVVSPAAMRLDRLNAGAPVLNTHSAYELDDVLGVVVPGSARIEAGQAMATLQLSARESIAEIVADIQAGIIRNISVGYMVHAYEITERQGERPLYRATDWEPAEISFVPIPADPAAGVRSADAAQGRFPCIISRAASGGPANPEAIMPDITAPSPVADPAPAPGNPAVTPPAGQQRAAAVTASAITIACRNAGLAQDVIDALHLRHEATPMDNAALMAAIGEHYATRSAPPTPGRLTITRDEGETAVAGMEGALLARLSRRAPDEAARPFMSFSLLEMGRRSLELRGISTTGLSRNELATRALGLTTSDLPGILQNVMNKRLRQQYEENQPSYMAWARQGPNMPDFKARSVPQLSGAPDLLPLNEAGEIKYGAWSDQTGSYALTTFGRKTVISRQTIINDDLGALDRWAQGFAGAARRLENRTVYAQLTGANTYRGGALFSAGNGNLAGAGAAIGLTTLAAGRAAMRLQRGLQNEELNITPRHLIVPATQETLAEQFVAGVISPNANANVNQFGPGGRSSLNLVVDAVLDATSTTAWFMAADSSAIDTVEYAYLEGAEGVQLASRELGGAQGIEIEAFLDFVASVLDHRGLWRNPGA